MSFPVFASGDVLNASDMNAVGLWLVSSTTLSINTQINNCFTSDYRNYRVVINIDSHVGGAINPLMQLSTGGTPFTTAANYFYSGFEQAYTSGSLVTYQNAGANANLLLGRLNGGTQGTIAFDIFNPQAASLPTFYRSAYADFSVSGSNGGLCSSTNQFDGMKIYLASGTSMTGRVNVYGYRN
jgi:hypothetical protein